MQFVSPHVERLKSFRIIAVIVVATITILGDGLHSITTEHSKRTALVAVASQHARICSVVHLVNAECIIELTRTLIVASERALYTNFHVRAGHRLSNGLLAPIKS